MMKIRCLTQEVVFFLLLSVVVCFLSAPAWGEEKSKNAEDPATLNESLAQLGKEMLGLRIENNELRAENERLAKRLFRYKKTIDENKELRLKIGKIKKELSQYQNNKNPLYKESQQLKDEVEKLRRINAQLEIKNKDLLLSVKDMEGALKDKRSIESAFESADKERARLKKENQEIFDSLSKETKDNKLKQALLYGELGSVYIKLRSYELAILAYEESLKLNPRAPENYYNLGILYNHAHRDKKKAVKYLKEYLMFESDAKNKKEVEYLIQMMSKDN
ncbi:MAG TPA: tetratricopeptide repeat protein [Candidatus Omnitrophota bacterium]|nr:tetratricopeptide repeat protein [Candidatus Omnitrophota bacterium]HPN88689.1 tetratricopeptide repeat protein [Candidatus Omnitrophota bacterium]